MKKITIIITMIICITIVFAEQVMADSDANAISNSETTSSATGYAGDVGSNNTSTSLAAPIPGGAQYGPVLSYFGQPLPSEGFQPASQLLQYACFFTEGALLSILKHSEKIQVEFKPVNEIDDPSINVRSDGQKWIKIIIWQSKIDGAKFIGYSTARSCSRKATSVEVMAKSALYALRNGCNVLQITTEGASRDVFSSGWGLGVSSSQAMIYDSQNRSNVTSGGTGYSTAKAGTRDLPWMQAFGLTDPNSVYPEK